MNILNSSEAFAALMAGKNILCRAVNEQLDFDDLNQFPATVFAMPGYEYCIEVETMELAGLTFDKPLQLEDIQIDDDVYVIQSSGEIYHYKYDGFNQALIQSIDRGFGQRNLDDARLQAKALCNLFDRVYRGADVIEIPAQPKKRARKAKNVEAGNSQNSTSNDVEEKPSESEPNIQIIEQDPVAAVEDGLTEAIETADRSIWPVSQTPSQKYIDMWLSRAKDEPTRRNLDLMKASMDHNWDKLDHDHQLQARQICADYEALVEQAEGEAIETDPASEAKTPEQSVQSIKNAEYESLFAELEERARNASSPAEANALYKYTMKWTEEQRKPLMTVINARLLELDQQNKTEPTTPPSLMVQIQNAPDLTALDALEIDVYSRHPDIQSKLIGYVKQRRFELQNQASEVVS